MKFAVALLVIALAASVSKVQAQSNFLEFAMLQNALGTLGGQTGANTVGTSGTGATGYPTGNAGSVSEIANPLGGSQPGGGQQGNNMFGLGAFGLLGDSMRDYSMCTMMFPTMPQLCMMGLY
ncbi:uncharacterized protein LOC127832581 [Dreissena polymorpha]|uniref:uncharacterized protein LOC127832581 n=1 Tax=Dreissena polymorpha TaxID=45954 RepID=UPI0022643CAE|nr:uncharacterized protein LOC127832581 [Dreissena polymorpha]